LRLRERARLSAALTRCALIRFRCKPGPDLSKPVGLRQWQQPKRFAPCGAVRVANPPSSCNPQSNELLLPSIFFRWEAARIGGLVPVVGQRPARDLRQSRRARSFLGNIRAILGLRGQGKCVRTSMDDTLSRHGRDGAGAPIWCYAGTRTRAAVGGFRQRGPALPIRFGHGDLVWDQVAIRLLCIRCDVLCLISRSRRLESMDRRLFTMMLHEVEERAISSTYCGRRRV